MKEKQIHEAFSAYLMKERLCFIHHRMDKKSGIQAGWPDFTICHVGKCLLVEVKTGKGKLSPIQENMCEVLQRRGNCVEIVRNVEQAVWAVQTWLGVENAGIQPPERENEASCKHPEWDRCTGPEGDPRVGKLICIDCGTPKNEVDGPSVSEGESSKGSGVSSDLWISTFAGHQWIFRGDSRPGGLCEMVRRPTASDLANLPRR